MFGNAFKWNIQPGAETLELQWIGKRPEPVDGIVLFKGKMDETAVLGSETFLVLITQCGSGQTARIMVPAVQPGLVDQRRFAKQPAFFL